MQVVMPQLGETVTEGTITAWHRKPGDVLEEGAPLFDVTTDKVDTEIPSPASGVLAEILVEVGTTVKVGTPLARIEAAGRAAPAPAVTAQRAPVDDARLLMGVGPAPLRVEGVRAGRGGGLLVTPLARRLMRDAGLSLAQVSPHAAGARINRAAVQAALAAARAAPAPAAQPATPQPPAAVPAAPALLALGTPWPMTPVRRRTAERLAEAWRTIPHVFQSVEADFSALDAARAARAARFEAAEGRRLTRLPFVLRALALALRDYPRANGFWLEGGPVVASRINLGIAVDLAHEGLVVPVLRDADRRTVRGLALELGDLVARARGGALKAEDMAEGTYTVTNNGAAGTRMTAAIINAPQVAILSLDAVERRPAVTRTADGQEVLAIRPIGVLGQSFDHRAFDGAYAGALLRRLRQLIEERDWTADWD